MTSTHSYSANRPPDSMRSRRRSLTGRALWLAASLALGAVVGCEGPGPTNNQGRTGGNTTRLALQPFASGFDAPMHLAHPPFDARLFVVEQPGRIQLLDDAGVPLATPYLDITGRVVSGGERGLFSLAFHPDFFFNAFVFVAYTASGGATVVERYTAVSGTALDPASALTIISVDQPFANHNGGFITFGPDGFLYLGLGDGGSAGDPQGHGQDSTTLLGSLLRIDVDNVAPGLNYAIPADNPFVGDPGRDEIWAYGLRNPWRFAFDFVDDVLYIGDVGQNAFEEISAVDAATPGVNFGWNRLEGLSCFNAATCDATGTELPVVTYANPAEGCAVTGGLVYRGSAIPSLVGHYFYSDYCSGFVRSFRFTGGDATAEQDWNLTASSVVSFGEDVDGELYVVSQDGSIFKIVPVS